MEDNEKTEIVNDYEVVEETNVSRGGSLLKPILAVTGLVAAGVGSLIFLKKRKKSNYAEIPMNDFDKSEQSDKETLVDED